MDDDPVAWLDRVGRGGQVLRRQDLEQGGRRELVGDAVGHGHGLANRHDDLLRVAPGRLLPRNAVAWRKLGDALARADDGAGTLDPEDARRVAAVAGRRALVNVA